jgi:hypothetical protein
MLLAKSFTKPVLYLIGINIITKLLLAPLLELGNDEVYYFTYLLRPDWNYFDHPPMVAWMIRVFTLNGLWTSEMSLRLGSIIASAISTWFIFKIGKLLSSERMGWYAAILYSASIYTGLIAGFFVLPDSPQMPLWTGALYIMGHLMLRKSDENNWSIWLLLGLVIGLAALCKVHALFLWAGFGLFILLQKRQWLVNPRLYISAFITILCLAPILFWNIQNDFITYRFHSERVTNTGVQLGSFFQEILGEFAYQNPIVFILVWIAVIMFVMRKFRFRQNRIGIWLLCMSLPMLFIFWGISLFNHTLPHWSGPAYIPLFFLAAVWFEQGKPIFFPFVFKMAIALVATVLIVAAVAVKFSPINFGSKSPESYGEYCPTLDLSGWNKLGENFKTMVTEDIENGEVKEGAVLLTNKWFPGGHMEFYVARPMGMPLIGIGELQDLHQFAWLNKERSPLQLGQDAYAIVPSNLPLNVADAYGSYFNTIEKPEKLLQQRGGGVVRYFYVYKLKECKKIPAPLVP